MSRLALLNTLLYPEVSEAVVEFIVELSTPGPREHRTSDEGLAEMMRLGLTDPSLVTDELIAAVVAPFATAEARLALARAGIGLSLSGLEEIAAGLGGIDVPVRVIYGEDDQLLPDVAATMTRLAADVPHAEITTIPRCGHFLQEEAPAQLAELLAPFFTPAGA